MKRIKSLADLARARDNRQSVWIFGKAIPAAVVINFNGSMLHNYIERGLYIYKPKTTKGKYKSWKFKNKMSVEASVVRHQQRRITSARATGTC